MKYCDKCGAEMLDEAVMCVKCGNTVGAEGKAKEIVYNERYCTKCGAKVFQETVVCPHCGCPMGNANVGKGKEKNKGIDIAIKVFLILTISVFAVYALISLIVLMCFYINGYEMINDLPYTYKMAHVTFISCILPLSWIMPISVIVMKKMKQNKTIGVGLKVCTLIFVNTIAGILLLARRND